MTSIETSPRRSPLTIAVGGGKGGVGKSVVALNLALSMTKLGARVTLVDADFGSANLHTMLGIDRPGVTLQALLDGRVKDLSEVVVATEFANLELVPGSVAVPGAANLHHARKQKLIRQIDKLACDVALIDCGAGIHYNTVDLFTAANMQLVIASPQLVSLQNAYGFLKASVYRMLRQYAQELGKAELVEAASDKSEVETVESLLVSVGQKDPGLGEALTRMLADLCCVLIGNQLSDPREQNALSALSRMIGDFLHLKVPVLGALLRKERIHSAVSRRRPFALDSSEPEARALWRIAEQLLALGDRLGTREREGSGAFAIGHAQRSAALFPSGSAPARQTDAPAVRESGQAPPTKSEPAPVHQSGINYRGTTSAAHDHERGREHDSVLARSRARSS